MRSDFWANPYLTQNKIKGINMDFKKLASNIGLDHDEFIELVELFIKTSNLDLEKLKIAFNSENADQVSEAAHTIKGASGNLGFFEISEAAEIIEKEARKGSLFGVKESIFVISEGLEIIKNIKI